MIPSCACCARKHLSRAEIRIEEYYLGHPEEGWKAVGEMSLAEAHCLRKWPDIARGIREARLRWMDSLNFDAPFEDDLQPFVDLLSEQFRLETIAAK